jgi:alkylated DNA nucleotide flippase Atl1
MAGCDIGKPSAGRWFGKDSSGASSLPWWRRINFSKEQVKDQEN